MQMRLLLVRPKECDEEEDDNMNVFHLFEGIWWKRELMFDELHPNGMGYLIMKENILYDLRAYFVANDMMEP